MPTRTFFWWMALLLVLLVACSPPLAPIENDLTQNQAANSAETTDSSEIISVAPTPDKHSVPTLDRRIHSVPLNRIYFDTFERTNRAIPLTVADSTLILRLRDAIPPIHNPKYEPAAVVDWLSDDDFVIGYTAGNEAWAYPVKILNYHEIVNDNLGGKDVLISYCPLCFSGVVFNRETEAGTLTFGNTNALYESDMVMLDYETGSYWWQIAGEAIVGELTGTTLPILPSQTITWGSWLALHPDTLILSRDTGFNRNYEADSFVTYEQFLSMGNFAFPVSEETESNTQLPAELRVLAVQVDDESRGYPLPKDGDGVSVINDVFNDQPIVVFVDNENGVGSAFSAELNGQPLSFEISNGEFVDTGTNSEWNFAGVSTEGDLAGSQLAPLPTRTSFWFAIFASEPTISIFEPNR